jgi:hypothetical protein
MRTLGSGGTLSKGRQYDGSGSSLGAMPAAAAAATQLG